MNDYLSAVGLALKKRVTLGGKGSLRSEENSYVVVLFNRPGGFGTFYAFVGEGEGSKHHALLLGTRQE